MKVDTEWFLETIRQSEHRTVSALASKMTNKVGKKMHHSILLRILKGERDLSLSDAYQLKTLLKLSWEDIERRTGVRNKK